MAGRKSLCRLYSLSDRDGAGSKGYQAVERLPQLPRSLKRDDQAVIRGYATHLDDAWFFFTALEPALTFGRAGRMSADCSSYGVIAAAVHLKFCPDHGVDERILLINGVNLDRNPDELAHIERFVQGVKQNDQSSYWRAPRE